MYNTFILIIFSLTIGILMAGKTADPQYASEQRIINYKADFIEVSSQYDLVHMRKNYTKPVHKFSWEYLTLVALYYQSKTLNYIDKILTNKVDNHYINNYHITKIITGNKQLYILSSKKKLYTLNLYILP